MPTVILRATERQMAGRVPPARSARRVSLSACINVIQANEHVDHLQRLAFGPLTSELGAEEHQDAGYPLRLAGVAPEALDRKLGHAMRAGNAAMPPPAPPPVCGCRIVPGGFWCLPRRQSALPHTTLPGCVEGRCMIACWRCLDGGGPCLGRRAKISHVLSTLRRSLPSPTSIWSACDLDGRTC